MIIDQLKNAALYEGLNPHFATAFDFLKKTSLTTLPLGKTIVDGERVFVAVSEYDTKNPSELKWEAHRNYIDIQFLAKGVERIGYAPLSDTEEVEAYKAEKDVLLLRPTKTVDYITLHDDTFALLFPDDAHQPCVLSEKSSYVRKIVVKVEVQASAKKAEEH